MEDEVKQKLNDTLLGMIDDLAKTKDFVIDQAPDVIQQLLVYKFYISIVCLILGLMFGVVVIYSVFKFIGAEPEDGKVIFGSAIGFLVGSFAGCGFILEGTAWFKIWLAPKLYLLEYAKDFF